MSKPTPSRKQNYAPVPLYRTHPLPPWQPTNPLCMLSILLTIILQHTVSPPQPAQTTDPSKAKTRIVGYLDRATRSVHVTDESAAKELWDGGFYGKGNLSRSVPEWKERQRRKAAAERNRRLDEDQGRVGDEVENGGRREKGRAAQEVTNDRRQARRKEKLERARKEIEELERRKMMESAEGSGESMANGRMHPGGPGESEKGDEKVVSAATNGDATAVGRSEEHLSASPEESDAVTARLEETVSSMQKEIPQRALHTEANTPSDPDEFAENQEHLQLDPCESVFLSYALGVISVIDPTTNTTLSNSDLLEHFCHMATSHTPTLKSNSFPSRTPLNPANPFLVLYIAYHHFRSLGWCARPGVKFSVDFLLYARGPPFAHAEFAVLVVPSFDSWGDADKEALRHQKSRTTAGGLGLARHSAAGDDWHWLHCVNRVQNQVRKTLVLCFVDVPAPGACEGWRDAQGTLRIGEVLQAYRVREFIVRRWSPNRNRD